MPSQSYQTEQECGNGSNDWAGAMHAWDLMRQYWRGGVTGYFYWNTSLLDGGVELGGRTRTFSHPAESVNTIVL